MKKLKLILPIFTSLFLLNSCNNDNEDPKPINEEELITTVLVTLTTGTQTVTLTYEDLDGDGPSPAIPSISGPLTANTVYTGSIQFLNKNVSPHEDLTEEVKEESEDHQVFYQAAASLGTFVYKDFDTNGKPIGIEFEFTTSTATTSNLTVTLRHLPNKNAAGVASGDITNAGGGTDAEAIFNLTVN